MIDATLASFERDVIDASREAPVLVDFWAPWCGPCRALGPLLEKLEREDAGRWRLVKVNSDENPELSQRFGVRSIPFVVAFADGKAVSSFVGAQPEGAIRRFLADLVPAPAEIALKEARDARARGDDGAAEKSLGRALALDPSFDAARIDLVQLLLDRGDTAAARGHWSLLSGRAAEAAGHAVAAARLEAAEKAASLPAASLLESRIAADPADLAARLDLAEIHIASRAFAPALDQLLEIVKRDRAFGDDIGRRKMLAVFEMADPDLVSDYRRRLAGALY